MLRGKSSMQIKKEELQAVCEPPVDKFASEGLNEFKVAHCERGERKLCTQSARDYSLVQY